MERFARFKFIITILFVFLSAGCSRVVITNYIKDENPYKKVLPANFALVLDAATRALTQSGWVVAETTDPAIFERQRAIGDQNIKQLLIMTDIRHTALFVGSRYARVNVFLRMISEENTEVEIRYLTVTSIPFKSFQNYKKDKFVKRLFAKIQETLNTEVK